MPHNGSTQLNSTHLSFQEFLCAEAMAERAKMLGRWPAQEFLTLLQMLHDSWSRGNWKLEEATEARLAGLALRNDTTGICVYSSIVTIVRSWELGSPARNQWREVVQRLGALACDEQVVLRPGACVVVWEGRSVGSNFTRTAPLALGIVVAKRAVDRCRHGTALAGSGCPSLLSRSVKPTCRVDRAGDASPAARRWVPPSPARSVRQVGLLGHRSGFRWPFYSKLSLDYSVKRSSGIYDQVRLQSRSAREPSAYSGRAGLCHNDQLIKAGLRVSEPLLTSIVCTECTA